MKKILDFDKVKDYFKNSINQLKTDKKALRNFIIITCVEVILLALTIVLDLISKKWAVDFLATQPGWNSVAIKGFLDFTYSENTGAGFGMFKDGTLALTVITSIVISFIFIFLLLYPRKEVWLRLALVFIAGGGIGNLVDRTQLGYVRDFLEFTFTDKWAIFNVADCFVTVGAVMMVGYLIYMVIEEFMSNKKKNDDNNTNIDEKSNLTEQNQENIEESSCDESVENCENIVDNDEAEEVAEQEIGTITEEK